MNDHNEHTDHQQRRWALLWLATGEILGTYPTAEAAHEAIAIKVLLPTGDPELPTAQPWQFEVVPT